MKTFNCKIPFIGFDLIEVEIENDNEFDSEKELLEAALEKAIDEVYDRLNGSNIERIEFFKIVEGSNNHRFTDIKIEGFVKEIEDADEETTD